MEREKKSNKKNFGRSKKRKFHGSTFAKKDKTNVVDSVSSGLSTMVSQPVDESWEKI